MCQEAVINSANGQSKSVLRVSGANVLDQLSTHSSQSRGCVLLSFLGATRDVVVSTSAFLAYHQCWSSSLS